MQINGSIFAAAGLVFLILPANNSAAQGPQRRPVLVVPRPAVGPQKQSPPPPTPKETPTTLTLFDNPDFTGTSYVVQLQPPPAVQAARIITMSEVTAAGLAGKVSSARIACGSRPSRVSLFDIDWGQFSIGTMIECSAGQTAEINLSASVGAPFDNKINAAVLVVHVRSTDNQPHLLTLSTLFAAAWKLQLQKALGSHAASTGTQIWLTDVQDFEIEQHLQLSHFGCTSRGASFKIRVNMTVSHFKPVFKGYGISSYVDSGLGDIWGCQSGMSSSLTGAMSEAITSLQEQLPGQVLTLVPESAIYYLAPQGTSADYDLFYDK